MRAATSINDEVIQPVAEHGILSETSMLTAIIVMDESGGFVTDSRFTLTKALHCCS